MVLGPAAYSLICGSCKTAAGFSYSAAECRNAPLEGRGRATARNGLATSPSQAAAGLLRDVLVTLGSALCQPP